MTRRRRGGPRGRDGPETTRRAGGHATTRMQGECRPRGPILPLPTAGLRFLASGLPLLAAVLALLSVDTVRLRAQERGDGWARCVTGAGTSSIRGRVVSQSDTVRERTGLSLDGDAIGEHCWLTARADGSFEFTELPAGRYSVDLASLGYFSAPPLEVDLPADTTLYLVIPTYPRDILRECMHAPRCAAMLTPRTAPELAGTEEALRVTALRVALVVAGGGWDEPDWVACVEGEEAAAAAALAEVFPRIGEAADCAPEPHAFERRFTHDPSGRPARILYVQRVTRPGEDTATVSLGYSAGRLWGAWYRCTFQRIDDAWVARSCMLVGVS